MKTITIKILKMHCTACAMNIDFDLEDLPGIISASTNYAKQICTVEYDENKISLDEILKQIKKTGYDGEINLSN